MNLPAMTLFGPAIGPKIPAIVENKKLLERIILNPKIMAGKPIIQGTRITVDFILNLLAHSASESEILNEYKALRVKDIQACFFLPQNHWRALTLCL